MSEEQNEVLAQQKLFWERRMYRSLTRHRRSCQLKNTSSVISLKMRTSILLGTSTIRSLRLISWCRPPVSRYAMAEHFADIKQAAVCGILTALQKYDSAVGAPFVAFQKRYIQDSIDDYIRTAQSGVITMTVDTYPVLRRIMAIYRQSGDDCSDSNIQKIASEVNMDVKSVRKYIAIGTLNERRVDFYRQYDEDGEETGEGIAVDTTSQPDKLYFRAMLYDALHQAYDSLTYGNNVRLPSILASAIHAGRSRK